MRRTDLPAPPPDGSGLRVAVVVAEFNPDITEGLRDGAIALLQEAGVAEVAVVGVPGALELPLVAARLAETHDAVVVAGAVIKGETDHYEYVAAAASTGLMEVSLRTGTPVGNALLTVHDVEHARARSAPGPLNKGAEAAAAAVRTARLLVDLG